MSQKHANTVYTGTVELKNGVYVFVSDEDGTETEINCGLPRGCRAGDLVCATERDGRIVVTEVLGPAADAEANIKAIMRRERLEDPFNFGAVLQAKQTAFAETTEFKKSRVDLRGKTVITLSESEGSRSECGFSVERDKDGNYVLGLHTIDAAEIIPKGSALEDAAFERGKTVVLPYKEIPMLPETLTQGPCFFEVGEDRLAVSYLLTIDENGKVLSFDFCESVVKTAANCLFDEIEALLLNYDTSAIMLLREAYASVFPTLNEMFMLGGIVQNARVLSGDADIDCAEQKLLYSRHGGKPIGVVSQKESDPKLLIRQFLAIAGKELALYLNRNNIPALYRVQPLPDKEDVERFESRANALGIDTKNAGGASVFAAAAERSHGMRTEELLLRELHSALKEPGFASKPVRHVVHATDMYVRLAYPVNRLADFCIQRIVKEVIASRESGEPIDREALSAYVDRAIEASNRLEKRASRAEEKIADLVALYVLRRGGGRRYTGLVSDVNEGTIKVLLDNGCTGYINLADYPSAEYKDGAVSFGGQTYSYGSDISARFKNADFRADRLWLAL